MSLFKRKKIQKYRVLSIDGGGLKGVFTAYAIYKLEEEYGIKILDHFDMVAGTSTGALIAAALLSGQTGKEIYEQYIDENNPIFKTKKNLSKQMGSTFLAQFEHESLEMELINQFKDMKLSELYKNSGEKDFAFFASNFSKGKPVIYASPSLRKSEMIKQDVTVYEALRSSTAAPFYFEPFVNKENELVVDGGLWANNPSLSAVALSTSIYDYRADQLEVLSFGQTFTQDLDFKIAKGKELLKNPMNNQFVLLLNSVLTLSINSQTEMVENILGDKVYRYVPEIHQKEATLKQVDRKFINYAKVYWEENKKTLVEFIKTGNNNKG